MKKSADKSITRKINVYIAFLVFFAMAVSVVIIERSVSADRQRAVSMYAHKMLDSSIFAKDELITRAVLGHDDAIRLFRERVKHEEGLEEVSMVGVKSSLEALSVPCNYEEAGYCYDKETQLLYTVYPLKYGDRDFGVLIKTKKIEMRDAWKNYLLSNILLSVVLIVLLSTFLGLYIKRNLVKPCNEIIKSMAPIARGSFDVKLPEPRNCEMKGLTRGIRKLINDIKSYQRISNKNVRLAAIGRTTAMIAHDVRKPFAQMKSVLEMLPDKKNDDVFMEYASQQVHESIRKADAMMSDILEYSRDVKLELNDVGVVAMLISALGDVFKNADNADVAVEYGYKHSRLVYVEEMKIARVFTNIVANALDAMNSRGKISIQMKNAEADGKDWVDVIIANTGPKIPGDALPHLFEPFFTKGKKSGTGLGLAICKKIVDAHGGNIRVESTDERTAFIIRLLAGHGEEVVNEKELIRHSSEIRDLMPVESRQRSVSENANLFLDLHKKRGGKSYLLIVDDEPLFRETIRSLINRVPEVRDNLKVIEADSAEVALKQFEARVFDYVITDIDMGRRNIDGYEFARAVLVAYPKSLVLVHSNKRIHGKDESLLGRKNFQGFLPKPMDEGELMYFLAGKVFEQPGLKAYEKRKKKNVLVINDEEIMRVALKFELRKTGTVQVMEAAGVSDALKIFKEHSVDVVLADINLGEDRDGYDILREVRAQNTTTRFYMMSGMSKEDEWPKAQEMGADGYIQLPYESEELRNILI